jgi:uncharacterized protein YcnI/copper(I)-binding protein
MSRSHLGAAAAVVLACLFATPHAAAHVTLERATTTANAAYMAVLRLPHGCGGEATQSVAVQIPEGVIDVKPMPKAGWQLETRQGRYAKSYDLSGKPVSEGVREIVWSGGSLADDRSDEFVFQVRVTAFDPGTVLAFPTTQTCATKSAGWVQVAGPGVDPHSLKMPAPTLRIEAQAQAAPAAPTTIKHGDLVLTSPWTREPPKGARVAGGFISITNTGSQPERLIGGSAPFAKRFEVHEMAVVQGVMRMREIAGGLVIRPGETVELKPGGLHVMFMDITEAPVAGRTVKTTLRFERAGPIEIDVAVTAPAAGGGHGHGGHKH